MIDLLSAAQAAVFEALKARVPGELAQVFDYVPQGTAPPFVKIGTIESTNVGGKSDQRERFELEVHSIYRGKDRGELLAIMHGVREALDDQPIEVEGIEFQPPILLEAVASDAAGDGLTYAGITTFEILAEPA